MTQFNPLAESILGSVQQQRLLAIQKSRRARRLHTLQTSIAAKDEQSQTEVESADALRDIGEEAQRRSAARFASSEAGDEDPPRESIRLDIKG